MFYLNFGIYIYEIFEITQLHKFSFWNFFNTCFIFYIFRLDISEDRTTDLSSNISNGSNAFATEYLSNDCQCSNTNMKTIPMELYMKLCNDSLKLFNAEKTIDKLTNSIKQKDNTILEIKKRLELGHLSPVSVRNL